MLTNIDTTKSRRKHFRVIDNPLLEYAERARKSYFAWTDFWAARRLYELEPTPGNELAFLQARAVWIATGGSS